ncbi:MAG: metallophosphoesterase [Planctomycetes bacterium]|nr:metallophosphoesterase [Planctomycetota bacterium]
MPYVSTSSFALALLLLSCMSAGCQDGRPRDPAAERSVEFTIPEAKAGEPYLRCLVMGDWGTGRADQKAVAAGMAKRQAAGGLDLVLTTGDNFYPTGVQSADDPLWEANFRGIYTDALRDLTWCPSLGNHDHLGKIEAQLDYAKRDPKWYLPARYHTFTRKLGDAQVQFFVLDTNPLHRGRDPQQLEWLREELSKSNARWRIVYGHHPLYSHSIRGFNRGLIAKLEPIFTRYSVDLYLAGHDHTLEMLKPVQGVNYVVSGGAAGADKAYEVSWTDESFYASTGGGFVVLRIGEGELVLEFVRTDGTTQYAHTIAKAPAKVH